MIRVTASSAPTAASAGKVGFWDRELSYAHGWAAVLAALGVGVLLHLQVGYAPGLAQLMAVAAIPAFILTPIVGRFARSHRVVHWLTGIPFAVCSTVAVGLLALVGGVVPESVLQQRLGLPSMWSSWPFLMVLALMLMNLLGSIGKRCVPLTYTNVVYLASHAGLAIALIGGAASALTMERLTVVLFEGQPTRLATHRDGRETQLPFEMTLRKFTLEAFQPTLAMAQLDPAAKDGMRVTNGSRFCAVGMTEKIDGVTVRVLRFLPKAAKMGETWRAVPFVTAAPAAEVEVTEKDGHKHVGWISCGSVEVPGSLVGLEGDRAIVMPDPRPKRFASDVDLVGSGPNQKVTLEVNQPAHRAGYELYQLSYDDKMGAASQYSVVEAVRDPGLPIVYLGMFLLLGGSLMHLWNGVGGKK